jgi:hypothetical protein
MYSVKRLDDSHLARIKELEQKLDCCIVAFDQLPEPAELSGLQLEDLNNLERETGSVLVAYKCK